MSPNIQEISKTKDYFSLNGKHPHKFNFCDQPMLNYLLNNQNFLDVSFLDDFVENNPHHYEVKNILKKIKSKQLIISPVRLDTRIRLRK